MAHTISIWCMAPRAHIRRSAGAFQDSSLTLIEPCAPKKERKKTDNPREGWEDGTPPPHRDFKERSVVLAVAHPNPWSSASFYLPSQSLADSRCNLHATSRSSHSRRSLPCACALSLLPLSRRSPLPRPATPPPPAGPLFSRLLTRPKDIHLENLGCSGGSH